MKKSSLFALLRVLLSIVIITSIIGCKESKSTTKNVSSKKLDGYLITEEPLELTIHMHFRNLYAWDEEWPVVQEVFKKTNILLKGVASKAGTDSDELFNLMLVSGKLPDIVGGNKRKDDYNRYGMEGAFIPLNDLIEEHAPHIRKLLDTYPEVKAKITAPDGNIYHVPYVVDGVAARGYFIRKDWLDKLGLEVPKTVHEFYNVMTAFKNQDPNGNGIADEVPIINRKWEEAVRLANLFGARVHGSDSYFDFYQENGIVKHSLVQPEFKDAMIEVAKWYAEGLIDKEIFTRGNKAREVMFSNNVGGFTHDWFASSANFNDALKDKIPGFNLVPIAPPADINGKSWEEHGRAKVKPDGWAITSANKHPVETIRLFDFYFTKLGRIMSNFGVEGLTYDLVDGKPKFKQEVLTSGKAVNQYLYEIGAQIPIGFQMDYEYERQWTNEIALKGVDMYINNNYIIESFPGVAFTKEEQKVYDTYWSNCETFYEETLQKWILGVEDVDQGWDKFIDDLDKMGYFKVIEAVQSAYDRMFK